MGRIQIDGEHLSFGQFYRIVQEQEMVEIAPAARERMIASRKVIERLVLSGAAVYGVNTGFGKMASVRISREQIGELMGVSHSSAHRFYQAGLKALRERLCDKCPNSTPK